LRPLGRLASPLLDVRRAARPARPEVPAVRREPAARSV